ncbi:hypothetical protein BDSB_23775 [Burkholderia dolosa PC543]|nr:hypothetical protein BDSB_23775 [Burkholderia dolosa PC543]
MPLRAVRAFECRSSFGRVQMALRIAAAHRVSSIACADGGSLRYLRLFGSSAFDDDDAR